MRETKAQGHWPEGAFESDLGISLNRARGAVLRKRLGYGHIAARHAGRLDAFNRTVLSPCRNDPWPCLFAGETVDAPWRPPKRSRQRDVMTPYEKLKSPPRAECCLRPGTSCAVLDAEARALSRRGAARRSTRRGARLRDRHAAA